MRMIYWLGYYWGRVYGVFAAGKRRGERSLRAAEDSSSFIYSWM
jgi:hypothetical protein